MELTLLNNLVEPLNLVESYVDMGHLEYIMLLF